ncbi:SART-1 protein [Fomes fomentarius]|nr:SART-1 protein [Fomes fomentarius]
MSMEESISLEETNKIRISLGLKPLTDDKAPATDKEKQAEDNYAKQREREVKERQTKAIQDRIAKVRNKKELNAKLKGATLGDTDGDVDDTLKWIKRSKKKEKELAKKRQEELEHMDKVFQGDEYTEKDLEGLKVSHDFEGLNEGEARILTLKDSRILDNEEDELQNVEMAEREREKQNQELKIKKRDYTGYDDEEFAPGVAGMKRAVLSKYDDFLEGPKETDFRLGSSTLISREMKDGSVAVPVNKSMLSIDYAKNLESADYLQSGDVGFKKPKTKKKRPTRRVNAEESDIPPVNGEDQMQVDEKPIVPRPRNLDVNFVDDDELQAALTRSRRAKLQKPKKLSSEEIAKRIAEQRAESEAKEVIMVDDDQEDGEGGLTIDDTSEFVRAITFDPTAVKKETVEPSIRHEQLGEPSQQPSALPRHGSEDIDHPMEELEAGEVVVKEEEDEEAMLNAIENAIKKTEEMEASQLSGQAEAGVGTSVEQTFGQGMAATLTILRQQGVLANPGADQSEREHVQLQRDLWLAEYRRTLAQRELERSKTRGGGNKDQATREYENRLREQQEARQNLEMYKTYKPDVNIVYYDEFGRVLTPKEAWKALSHKFHGKGSGKAKTEKRLKKIAEERKKEAMASGDTPLSMNQAFQIRQEKTGQAHFVLSVGNRGAVPQASEFLDSQPLSKGKTEKKNKKKQSGKDATPQLDSTGFMTLPAPLLNGGSPAPGASANGSPAPRPGFSRISTMAEVETHDGTPVPAERTKVVIGLGAKRKAAGEAQGTPPPKRR